MEHPDVDKATLLGPDARLDIPEEEAGGIDMETKLKLGIMPEDQEAAPGCAEFRKLNGTPSCMVHDCVRCIHVRAQLHAVVQHGTMTDLEQVMAATAKEDPEDKPAPVPVMRGRFAVYDTPDGGYHLTYQLEGEEQPQHMEFPGMFVSLAKKRGAAIGAVPGMAGFMKLFGGE